MHSHIGVIGYGEVGKIFAASLKTKTGVATVSAWDLKFSDSEQLEAQQKHAQDASVFVASSQQDLCARADFLISAVTASSTLAVAVEAARHLRPGTLFLDLNSASPGTKQQAAKAIEAAGGEYVEAGVMSSIPPYGIKGLEALVIESYATARHYGVEDYVLPTLAETFPSIDWEQQGAYFFSRVVEHGKRRAEEMREAARTVHEAGFDPLMTSGTAAKQQWVADQAAAGVFAGLAKDASWQDYADCLLAASKPSTR